MSRPQIAGVTYRQFDYWCRLGLIPDAVSAGSGRPRTITTAGIRAACALARLSALGVAPGGPLARSIVRRVAAGSVGRLEVDGLDVDLAAIGRPL